MTIWNNRAKWRLICSVSDELVFAFSSPPQKNSNLVLAF